jgi:hypothetical protein
MRSRSGRGVTSSGRCVCLLRSCVVRLVLGRSGIIGSSCSGSGSCRIVVVLVLVEDFANESHDCFV